jgi:16S rRNA C967 or C1407 C5-methylase (RsmB/RsmF family)
LQRGAAGFHQYFGDLFNERWPALSAALTAPARYTAITGESVEPYYLDPASVAVAELLPLTDATEVVDLCAAPGGKALVLARRIRNDDAAEAQPRLVLNERSARRRHRLIRVVADHIPGEQRSFVTIHGHDAARWGIHRPLSAGAILADVPCSSEAHLLTDPSKLDAWSPTRIRRNAAVQHGILAAAIDALRPGGHVLYATCALSPEENDEVIDWALTRRSGLVEVIPAAGRPIMAVDFAHPPFAFPESAAILAAAEPTRHGIGILPDRATGSGPLYAALLRRAG